MLGKTAVLLIIVLITACLVLVAPNYISAQTGDTWTSKASMHTARSQLGVATVNGKTYAIGGCTAEGYIPNNEGNNFKTKGWITNANEEYDPTTDKWITRTPMPTARYNFTIAAYQGKIYCLGGVINNYVGIYVNYTNANEVYDPITNSWETKTPIPETDLGQANVVDDKIYFIGGGPNGTSNLVYDPKLDSWNTKASLPEKVKWQVSATVGEQIYVIGFFVSIGFENTVSKNYVYNPTTDCWSNCTGIPNDAFDGKGVPWRGNWWSISAGATTGELASKRIYVIFMQYVYSGALPMMVYNPFNENWTMAAAEPVNRQNFAVTVLNDKMYVIGGEALTYPYPGDNYFTVKALGDNLEYTPLGYGTPEAEPTPSPTPEITATSSPQTTNNPDNTQQNPLTPIAAISVASIAVAGIGAFFWNLKREKPKKFFA
jgi:N-acetylneuraminic acid mutarotase